MKTLAKQLFPRLQRSRLWRAIGRCYVLPRLSIVRALDDPQARWRQVYGDFDRRRAGAAGLEAARRLEAAWIAVWGRRALGGMLLAVFEHGLFLSTMRVRPGFRGWGVGRALAAHAVAEGRRLHRDVWLVVRPENTPAISAYEAVGFLVQEPPTPVDRPEHDAYRWSMRASRPARPSAPLSASRPR
ncbi:MAG: GNAT family N-acetyltransferase [Acidobacteriota bacterium]|nr:MAG: GNAT family N-acetyltransferase [Acidobacteriota bacterium]